MPTPVTAAAILFFRAIFKMSIWTKVADEVEQDKNNLGELQNLGRQKLVCGRLFAKMAKIVLSIPVL